MGYRWRGLGFGDAAMHCSPIVAGLGQFPDDPPPTNPVPPRRRNAIGSEYGAPRNGSTSPRCLEDAPERVSDLLWVLPSLTCGYSHSHGPFPQVSEF